uniref:C-type lectin domain-containing protein n=1 Tax=Cyprinus carpio carpio TaxID=630221 RepID=A0A9J8CJ00_CYPCA
MALDLKVSVPLIFLHIRIQHQTVLINSREDLCEQSWKGVCLMSWPETQSYCRERFTDLATVDSMDDVNRLVNIVDAGYSGSVWIGLKRRTQKRWVWSNGENTTSQYYNWASGQPNWDGDCVATYAGVWHDMSCSYKRYFVCYAEEHGAGK